MKKCAVLFLILVMFEGLAVASPIQWAVDNGGNDHWYEIVVPDDGDISWSDASAAANAAGGYLATITSIEENAFIMGTLLGCTANDYAVGTSYTDGGDYEDYLIFLGGLQSDEQWEWVTGEAWDFVLGESDLGGSYTSSRNWLGLQIQGGTSSDEKNTMWFDIPNDPVGDSHFPRNGYWSSNAYIIEYDNVNPLPTPEPATMVLFGLGLLGLAGVSRFKKSIIS